MIKTFQLKLEEELNTQVLMKAAKEGTNKHAVIVRAIKKLLAEEKAV